MLRGQTRIANPGKVNYRPLKAVSLKTVYLIFLFLNPLNRNTVVVIQTSLMEAGHGYDCK